MKYTMMRYVATHRRHDGASILMGTPDGDTWYVGGELRSEIRGEFHEQYDILKEYGEDVDNSGDVYDQWIQDYPPQPCDLAALPNTFVVPEGWLSPEGKFYPCHNGEHVSFAYDLRMAFYGPDHAMNNYDYLECRGWVHIGYGLVTFDYDKSTISAAQVKMLRQMQIMGASEESYVKGIDRFLELADVNPMPTTKLITPKRG